MYYKKYILPLFIFLLAQPLVDILHAGDFTSIGAGGGGWLQAGAFHPLDSDVIVIGTDLTGGAYRTEDFGLSWRAFNDGLTSDEEKASMHIDDLLGVHNDHFTGFIAATWGGIYSRADGESWRCDTPMVDYCWTRTASWNQDVLEAISFTSIDSDGNNLLVAGAARSRWDRPEFETLYYPGVPSDDFRGSVESDTEQYSVWTWNFADSTPRWRPLGRKCLFGATRDVSMAIIEADTCVAVATHDSLMLYTNGVWESLADRPLYHDGVAATDWSNDVLDCFSLHLTRRGILYAAMTSLNESILPGGVYRLHVNAVTPAWVWVGDGSSIAEFDNDAMDELRNTHHLVHVSVDEGSEFDPDIVYVGDAQGFYPVSRVTIPFTPGDPMAELGTWEASIYLEQWRLRCLDPGWISEFPGSVHFPIAISPSDPNRLAVHLNGRMHVSEDHGANWLQRYAIDQGDGYWTSRGFNELCVVGLAVDSEGRLLESTGDLGLLISEDTAWTNFRLTNPEVGSLSMVTAQSNGIWTEESGAIVNQADWRGSGDDALFIHFGDAIGKNKPGKIMMLHRDSWTNVTSEVANLTRYLFLAMELYDDETLYVTYDYYSGTVGASSSTIIDSGVLRLAYDAETATWNPAFINDGLETSDGARHVIGSGLLRHRQSGRLFLAGSYRLPYSASLYYLDDSADTTWKCAFAESDSVLYRDIRCLAQSADGSKVYVGTRGRSGAGMGTILKCTDAGADRMYWTPLVNTTLQSCPFEFGSPPGVQYDALRSNQIRTDVRTITVDPDDGDTIYVGLSTSGFTTNEGLWSFDGYTWTHMSAEEDFIGMGVLHTLIHDDGRKRLVIGTNGQESYVTELERGEIIRESGAIETSSLMMRRVADPLDTGLTVFSFTLPYGGPTTIDIIDLRGRLVHRIDRSFLSAGQYSAEWNGSLTTGGRASSGLYFAKLKTSSGATSLKFTIVR